MTIDAKSKALKLLALAVGSTYEEERRTAALAACKLIHEHELLNETLPQTTLPQTESPGEAYARHQQAEHEVWRNHWAQYGTSPPHPTSGPKPSGAARSDPWYKEEEARYEARRAAREAQGQPTVEAPPPPDTERYRIRAKYGATCRFCGVAIRIDDVCYWRQGDGVWCPTCYLGRDEYEEVDNDL